MRRTCVVITVLGLAVIAGWMVGACAGQTAATPAPPSPAGPGSAGGAGVSNLSEPIGRVTELPPVNWPTPAMFIPGVYRCACECEPTPTPTPEPPPTVTLTIWDCTGQITNTLWLTTTFGDVRWSPGSLAELRCSIGPSVLVAHAQDADGQPVANATVVLYWPDAPWLPPELQSCALDRGVYGPTNLNGDIGFGLGPGSYYFPPSGGPHVMWVAGSPSCLAGLGMLGGTEHQHLDSTWQVSAGMVESVGDDWGYSTGAVMYEMTIEGRRMWVIRMP